MKYSKEYRKGHDDYKKYIAVVAVIAIVILSSYLYFNRGEKENRLSVDAMYLVKNDGEDEKVNVSAIIYLTNIGADSGDVEIITYIMERWKGIAVDKKEIEIGEIEKDKTTEVER